MEENKIYYSYVICKNNMRILSFGWFISDNHITAAVCFCKPGDEFSKKIARHILNNRLKENICIKFEPASIDLKNLKEIKGKEINVILKEHFYANKKLWAKKMNIPDGI